MKTYPLYPLSHAEKRIYITQKTYPQSSMWNIINSVRIEKAVHPALLIRALRRITASHQNLRLHFTEQDGEPRQYDKKDTQPVIRELDFIGHGGGKKYKEWLQEECNTPLSLDDAPPHLFVIATVAQNVTYLVVKLHHIASDGHALATITRRIITCYESLLSDGTEQEGQGADNNVEQPGFLDTLAVEERYVQSAQYGQDEQYWFNRFQSPPEPVELVPRSTEFGLASEMLEIAVDPELNRKLLAFCRSSHHSPFRLFLAALYTCLARRSGKSDISIGSASFNRGNGEIDDTVTGMFVSTLPLRLQCPLEKTFSELLGATRTTVKEALVHQRYPYDQLIAKLREFTGEIPELIPVSLVQFLRADLPDGYTATLVPPAQSLSRLTIYLSYDVHGNEEARPVTLYGTYATSEFTRQEAELLMQHVINTVADGIAAPDKSLSRMNILSAQEQKQIIQGFNTSSNRYPGGRPIHVWIEKQAAKNPRKTAVVYKNRQLSYAEMNGRANQLARTLRENGVKQDTIVGLWGERSLELIIGQLAILKAGGAFMPIDEKYPLDRVRFMMEDSRAPVLLTQQHFAGKIDFPTRILTLDDPALFTGETSDLSPLATENDLAVLIYTSGSTGKPKGVMIEHRSMTNFIFVCIDDLELSDQDGVAKHASFSFDASNIEIYPCLCAGGTLHIIPEELRLSLSPLNEYYQKNNITFAMFTTQLGEKFMDLMDNTSLRNVIVGGEKLRTFRRRRYRLINGYGPTECTVMATSYPVSELEENIPIGKPLTNYKVLVLDRFGNLQPVGVPGELCICGVSVARGYLNRPKKTAEAFGTSPFDDSERMYHTSDLAYWRPDGNLVYLGRMDRQVKLRGYRVELGEIEQAMLAVEQITEAAVVDLKDAGGRLYLCGYYVASGELKQNELEHILQENLPSFMVPAHLVRLDTLPVTPNGKIDRKKLPEPKLETAHPEMFVAPETETERHLAKIWSGLLQLEKIGRRDNFFNIGGDSLKSVSLQVLIEQQFQVAPTITSLFKAATLQEQSLLIESLGHRNRVEIPAAPPSDTYPTTVSQKQLYILSCFKDAGTVYNIPFQIELKGNVDQKRLSEAVQAMVKRFAILRTSFEVLDGRPVQRVHPEVYLKLEYGEAPDADLDNAAAGFVRPFNLAKAPLFRVKLVKLGDQHHVLLVDIHHIISDGVSVGLFMQELSTLYNGGRSTAPEVQFKDYAVWSHEHRNDTKNVESGRFWHDLFRDPPEVELPLDHPRPPRAEFRGGQLEFVLDEELTAGLKKIARNSGATLHHILLAILAVLTGKYTQCDDLVLGTTTAGRFAAGTEEMMGMFVNTLPVRLQPAGAKRFSQLLAEVRDMMLQVLDHESYPIDQLYETLNINRGPGQNPLFDINFVLRNMEIRRLELEGGVRASLKLISNATAKFDLSFAAEEKSIGGNDGEGSVIAFHLEYRSALFDHATIERMAGHFMRIAGGVVSQPDIRLDAIEFLHSDEKNFLRYQINDTRTQPPSWQTVARAFESNVQRYPTKTALVAAGTRLSYRKLNEQANRFAALLIEKALPVDTIIAIVADRSVEAVIGMLGALKAGVAYVGIDPGYPKERIEFILKDTAAPLIAGNNKGLASFSFPGEQVRLESLPPELSADNPVQTPAGNTLAYIIFTSGSTGTPKGVMIEHHSMVNFIDWYVRFNGISSDENCAEFAAFSFDVSVVQVFAPLVAGATLHVIPEELRRNPFELNDYYNKHRVTHTHLPTRFAEQFMQAVDNHSLKRIVVGGDRLRNYSLDRSGSLRLINEYGPSETCMASTALTVSKQYSRVPIGTPIANTRVYVLGKDHALRPIGLPGELCIAGAGVARGYLNRPELTAEKFVTDPFDPDKPMYKTGDIARILADGTVDFIGRRDFQVKIRGYRIEPGEIEERINRHPAVEHCVVIPIENENAGDKSLCAYYQTTRKVSADDLKKRLSRELPEYMIPSFFVRMEKLPLNRNGKIDRHALPRPELQVSDGTEKIRPSTDKEKKIAAVWEKVTGFADIGLHDNFFEIGGDSLKAIILMVELQSILDISTNDVFAFPTIAEQAENIKDAADTIVTRIHQLKKLARADDPGKDKAIQAAYSRYRQGLEHYKELDLSRRKTYRNILLTGATGTLGAYLLNGLLEKTEAALILLVRGESDTHCLQRVQDHFQYTFGCPLSAQQLARMQVVQGNLSEDNLGLRREIYDDLTRRVDCILHSAANVRHAGEYEEFHLANVVSTEQLLALLETGERKGDFHYISTTSVGAGKVPGRTAVFFSEDELDVGQECDNVYVRSKISAEKAIHAARERGINGHIYRAGNITVDSRTGRFQKNIDENGFFQQLKAYINIGAVPDAMDVRNISFVDCVSEAILTLFDRQALCNETFHIENPHLLKISGLLTAPELGLNVKKMKFDDFIDFFAGKYGRAGFGPYLDRLMMHLGWVDFLNNGPGTVFIRPVEKTIQLLDMAGFSWPKPHPEQFVRLLEHGYRDRLEFFSKAALFSGVEQEQLLRVCKKAEMCLTEDSSLLFKESEGCSFMSLIAEGNVELSRLSINGWIGTLRLVGEGTPLGLSNLRNDGPLPWSAEAMGELLWYKVDHDDLRQLMTRSPQLSLNIIEELKESLTALSRFVVALT